MKILTTAKEIRKALKKVLPRKIAVAYIGVGWNKFVSSNTLEEIIISPTLGSNPKAIEEIIQILGHENVHFLDRLHAKIYLGLESALIGSCNLSKNGMEDNHLYESSVLVSGLKSLEKLGKAFERFKKEAIKLYPNPETKIEKLKKLKIQWDTAIWSGIKEDDSREPLLMNYTSNLDNIHIVWYQPCDLEYDENSVNAEVPDSKGISIDDFFYDTFNFHEDDQIKPGNWLLCWLCNDNGLPRKNGRISWMQVHYVVSNGVVDKKYTKLAGQANNLNMGTPPFKLDQLTKDLIRDALCSGKFPELLAIDETTWKLAPADAITDKFLSHVRKAQHQKATADGYRRR
jgi:hypothetical protein